MGGSSPLSRGIRTCGSQIPALRRIIPALAGNTRQSPSPRPRGQDHPRSRGEYQASFSRISRSLGSSPLSRGIPGLLLEDLEVLGIIPALAGNTWTAWSTPIRPRDHPRSRGEYPRAWAIALITAGSSPLSRGIPGAAAPSGPGRWIIPALAGNTSPPRRPG